MGETERKSKKWRDKNREESADGSCADVPVEKKKDCAMIRGGKMSIFCRANGFWADLDDRITILGPISYSR